MGVKKLLLGLVTYGVFALLQTAPVSAHHSTTMFDMNKEITASGTVEAWQFVNPHSWLQVVVADSEGNSMQWSLETLGFPGIDLHKDSFRKGEEIAVIFNPMRNGRPAGILLEALSESGQEWKFRYRQ